MAVVYERKKTNSSKEHPVDYKYAIRAHATDLCGSSLFWPVTLRNNIGTLLPGFQYARIISSTFLVIECGSGLISFKR